MQLKKIRIIHFITSLGIGGAENVLYNLLKQNDNQIYEHEIICLNSGGLLKKKIKQLNIKVICLNLDKNFIKGILKCYGYINKKKNKKKIIVQT